MSKYKRTLFWYLFLVLYYLICIPNVSIAVNEGTILRFVFNIEKFYQDPLSTPTGIYIDKGRKEIYVSDAGRNEVLIFDLKGNALFKFGKEQGVSNPLDMIVKNSRIYLVQEGKPYIEIFNYRGESVSKIVPPNDIPFTPGRITLDEDGKIYVINKDETNCLIFDKNDTFIGSIGLRLTSLAGIAVSKDRVYLITPFSTRAIQTYDKKGNFINAYEAIEGEGGTLGLAVSAMIDKEGLLWIVDALKGISVYNIGGKKLLQFNEYGVEKGQLFFPIDIDFDNDDMVYIVDRGAKRISIFKIERQGMFLSK